jgi:hypothetical protein
MSGKTQFEIEIRALMERVATAQEAIQAAQEVEAGAGAFAVTYVFPAKDFGAGNWTEDIQGPPGLRGLVKAISAYDITEAFNGSVTESRVEVGIQGGDADAYVISDDFVEGAGTAIAAGFTPALTAGVVGTIPAAEDLIVTGYAPNDSGANEGIATIAVTISYFV